MGAPHRNNVLVPVFVVADLSSHRERRMAFGGGGTPVTCLFSPGCWGAFIYFRANSCDYDGCNWSVLTQGLDTNPALEWMGGSDHCLNKTGQTRF